MFVSREFTHIISIIHDTTKLSCWSWVLAGELVDAVYAVYNLSLSTHTHTQKRLTFLIGVAPGQVCRVSAMICGSALRSTTFRALAHRSAWCVECTVSGTINRQLCIQIFIVLMVLTFGRAIQIHSVQVCRQELNCKKKIQYILFKSWNWLKKPKCSSLCQFSCQSFFQTFYTNAECSGIYIYVQHSSQTEFVPTSNNKCVQLK